MASKTSTPKTLKAKKRSPAKKERKTSVHKKPALTVSAKRLLKDADKLKRDVLPHYSPAELNNELSEREKKEIQERGDAPVSLTHPNNPNPLPPDTTKREIDINDATGQIEELFHKVRQREEAKFEEARTRAQAEFVAKKDEVMQQLHAQLRELAAKITSEISQVRDEGIDKIKQAEGEGVARIKQAANEEAKRLVEEIRKGLQPKPEPEPKPEPRKSWRAVAGEFARRSGRGFVALPGTMWRSKGTLLTSMAIGFAARTAIRYSFAACAPLITVPAIVLVHPIFVTAIAGAATGAVVGIIRTPFTMRGIPKDQRNWKRALLSNAAIGAIGGGIGAEIAQYLLPIPVLAPLANFMHEHFGLSSCGVPSGYPGVTLQQPPMHTLIIPPGGTPSAVSPGITSPVIPPAPEPVSPTPSPLVPTHPATPIIPAPVQPAPTTPPITQPAPTPAPVLPAHPASPPPSIPTLKSHLREALQQHMLDRYPKLKTLVTGALHSHDPRLIQHAAKEASFRLDWGRGHSHASQALGARIIEQGARFATDHNLHDANSGMLRRDWADVLRLKLFGMHPVPAAPTTPPTPIMPYLHAVQPPLYNV